jgi:radical SAM protein with 4Fe4S-binding SPASM domain
MVDLLKEEPIKEMTFNVCGICASEDSNNSYLINPFDAVKAFEEVYSYAKENGVKARLVTPMPFCFFDLKFLPELKGEHLISGGPCQLSSGKNFVIEYNGDVVPCNHLAHFPMTNIFRGNKLISKEEFIQIYNDPNKTPSQLREKMGRYPSKKCEEPSCTEPCSGGCPLYWIKFNPEKEIKGISHN